MSDDERCDLSDLPVRQCACRIHGPKPEPGTVRFGTSFAARYEGTCEDCEEGIVPGDIITRGSDGYRHQACP